MDTTGENVTQTNTPAGYPDEKWRVMPFRGKPYEISSYGRVRNSNTGTILKQQAKAKGYFRVALHCDGKLRQIYVHRAVYMAFVGKIPSGAEIRHLDNNPRNNHFANLEARNGAAIDDDQQLGDSSKRPLPSPWPWPEIVKMSAHAGTGQWRKRHKGKDYYFGPLSDPAAALAIWRRDWPAITSGKPRLRAVKSSVKMAELGLAFVRAQKAKMDRGEITWASYREYREITQMVMDALGQDANPNDFTPQDFSALMARFAKYSPIRRRNLVVKVRSIFTWGKDAKMIDAAPEYGPDFKGPPTKLIRRHKREKGERWFTPAEIHALLKLASPQMKALILLGLNCGMGNTDAGQLPRSAVNLKSKMLEYNRMKTESLRRAPLWPETVAAMRKIMDHGHDVIFVSDSGLPMCRDGTDMIGKQFQILASAAGVTLRYYDLRRTFATVAAQSTDDHARKIIMGHAIDGVHEGYIQHFPVKRLKDVTDLVRRWLYGGRNRRR